MITLSIDENNKEVLRVSASYLLALAGDITATIQDRPAPDECGFTDEEIKTSEREFGEGKSEATPDPASVFAPSIADAKASPTAPEDTAETTSTPTSNVPSPPAQSTPDTVETVAPPTANPATNVEVDKDGLPWDARIHSRGKTKLKSGHWTKKRGVPSDLLESVTEELTALMAIPAPSSDPADSASAPANSPETPATPSSTATTASPSNNIPSPPATDEPPMTFAGLMSKTSKLVGSGTITQLELNEIVQAQGVAGIPLLVQRPDLIPAIDVAVDALVATKGA